MTNITAAIFSLGTNTDGKIGTAPVLKAATPFYRLIGTEASARDIRVVESAGSALLQQNTGTEAAPTWTTRFTVDMGTGALTLGTVLAAAQGGTGSANFAVAGPTLLRTYTFPDASTTILTTNSVVTPAQGGTGLASGTSGGVLGFTAAGTIASSAALTANALVLGGGAGATPTVLGSLGTTTTVLHGNAVGAPTFGAVALATDVSGALPVANGGTALTATPANGQLPIGNATGYTLATLTAGANIAITNVAGAITIASSRPTITGSVVLTPNQFTIQAGTPVIDNGGAVQGFSLPSGATNSTIMASCALPRNWASGGVTIFLHWINNGAGTGNVRWRVQFLGAQAGATQGSVSLLDSLQTIAAAAQNVLTITNYGVSSAPAGVPETLNMLVFRNSADVADTLANAIKLLAVELVYTES